MKKQTVPVVDSSDAMHIIMEIIYICNMQMVCLSAHCETLCPKYEDSIFTLSINALSSCI